MTNLPWEYALIGFGGNQFSGKIVPELLDLAQRGIVRYVDIVFISKEQDGSLRTVELNDLDAESYKLFVPLGEHITGLFTEEDLSLEADRLPANSSAVLVLWENLWMGNVRKAIDDAQGVLLDRGQISAEVVELVKPDLTTE
jgi:hypothetical protein